VACDVPGVKKEEVSVKVTDDGNGGAVLTISGERKAESKDETADKKVYCERRM
jgi:HSP20 family molecular chaperone IbpA